MPPEIRDVLDLLKRDGWIEIAVRAGDDVAPGTLNSILKRTQEVTPYATRS